MKTVVAPKQRNMVYLQIYLGLIILSGIGLMALSFPNLTVNMHTMLIVFVFAGLAIIAEMWPVYLPEHCVICVSSAFHIACYLLFGTAPAVMVAVIGSGIADLRERRAWHKTMFNIAQYALCTGIAGEVYRLLRVSGSGAMVLTQDYAALGLSVLTYFGLNSLFISVVIALAENYSVTDIWAINIKDVAFQFFASAAIGILISVTYHAQPAAIGLLMLPLLIVYFALRNYMDLRTQTQTVLEMLADFVDKRDPYTYHHSQRVAEYAVKITRKLNLSEAEVDVIRSAARVHDLGKITLDNSILLKPDRLTDAEYAVVKQHPAVGAAIVKQLKSYANGAEYVLNHHEFYNGKGYPAGLAGELIPLGGRILAVADSYDAMTTDRPYRKARTRTQAISILQEASGTQFDPRVVHAMLAVLAEENEE